MSVERLDVYQGTELVGTVPVPDMPFRDTLSLMSLPDTISLGIRRAKFEDQFASVVTFKAKFRDDDNGWIRRAALYCSPMFGPGDLECVPGFRPTPTLSTSGAMRPREAHRAP